MAGDGGRWAVLHCRFSKQHVLGHEGFQMQRREFIAGLGGAVAWPLTASAQQDGRLRRIGVLMNAAATETEYQSYLAAFIQGLRQLGWTEGQNLRIDVRWNAGDA